MTSPVSTAVGGRALAPLAKPHTCEQFNSVYFRTRLSITTTYQIEGKVNFTLRQYFFNVKNILLRK